MEKEKNINSIKDRHALSHDNEEELRNLPNGAIDEDEETDEPDEESGEEIAAKLTERLAERKERAEAMKALEKFAEEEDSGLGEVSLRTIIGGDILKSKFLVNQIFFIMMITGMLLINTYNRYSSQNDIIYIDSLKIQLQQERYNTLTQSSELLNFTRQSNIEKLLKQAGDTTLVNPTIPPFLVKESDDEPEEE